MVGYKKKYMVREFNELERVRGLVRREGDEVIRGVNCDKIA